MTRWNLHLPDQVLKFLAKEAKRTGLTKSELVRNALYAHFKLAAK